MKENPLPMRMNKDMAVSYSSETDETLTLLAVTDQVAFGELISRYQQKLFWYVRRISGFSDEEIEDIVQDVFIKAYYNLNKFDESLKFSSWIYRITHNHTISAFRKVKVRPQQIIIEDKDTFFQNISSEEDLHEQLVKKELKNEIAEILGKMDIKYREVLILKFLEEKSYEEMSDILKKPIGTIGTLVNRAKKQFAK